MMKKEPIRVVLESLTHPVYKLYSSSKRSWEYHGMDLVVLPGIFHPGWFVTSVMLLEQLEGLDLSGKRILEMGCGAGVLACRAVQLGAQGFASDITSLACENAAQNTFRNELDVEVIQSDIFDQMSENQQFDYIFVNPPFKPDYPESQDDFAFCCGEGYEYYIALFGSLKKHLTPNGTLVMALAKSCEIDRILEIADFEKISYERILTKRKWSETNYLYSFSCR
ncbi:class I SAM-dependent methyltransferase [Cryomorphaceae bacterium 1068]|nr:class I SAM-dependent methyltransferase [Cryomorphaceae bacterium 1068]